MEDRPQIGCVEDLATLTKLDEQILLEELQERYRRDLIYTYVGDILIAVNPFKDIGIYGKKETEKYKNAKKSSNPPHIFAVSDMAFQSISGYGGLRPKDQCILISGESGAGKTESTKLIIKQLIELSHGTSQLEQQILQVNPLLEAFGNAQTLMNDNSSRFGKYIQLRFLDGQVKGAKISEYLLEKSRVVGQHEEEENFHIFYYLFAGQTTENNTSNLFLKDPNKFRYLTNGVENFNSNLPYLTKQYSELLNSMDLVGFTDSEQETLFTMIAGILHLGNITFETNEENDETLVSNPGGDLQTAANLLKIDAKELQSCLTSMIAVAGGEYMQINYNKSKAADCRDALSKAIYGRLFGWIVNKINQLLAPELLPYNEEYREIGILDIFGFEHFEKNSFEQACINLANEQLQFFFNQHIFKMEQEEYMKEGIDWTEVKFVDNKPLLDMFLTKPVGIISLLDEECYFPKATNQTFVEKLNQNFHKHQNFQKSQQSKSAVFTIHHYAGKVTYDTSKWLEKNRDTLPEGISDIMKSSKNQLIKTLFQAEISRTGTLALQGRKSTRSKNTKNRKGPVKVSQDAKRKATVGTKFKRSLNMLMEKMTRSSPIFVRCLKPNHNKRAGEFNNAYIQAQLLYTGMLETTKIRREGYAIRPPFGEFVERYKILIHKHNLKGTSTNCMEILKSTGLSGWHIGKTKVFLKYWHIEKMADLLVTLGNAATQLQRVVRGFLARKEFARRVAERKAAELARLARIEEQKNAAKAAEQARLLEMNKIKSKDVKYGGHGVVPRAFPDDVPNGKHNLSIGTQSDMNSRSMCTQGTQMEDIDSSDSDDVLQDIFVALEDNNKYGTPGTKEATLGWFAETQTEQVYDHDAGMFAEWFHGIISRRDSENLLKNKPIGCFLIRVSESRFGYSLSFKVDNRCRHYMIDQLKNGKFVICGEKKVHRSLQNMVEYYRQNKISNYDGYLTEPCGQAHGECDYTELLNDQVYHVLEESAKQYYKVPPKRKESPSGPSPPALPPRRISKLTTDYQVASDPEASRKRLLLNQTQQHANDSTIFSTVNRQR